MENRKHCERIARELDKIANGDVYICPECGEHAAITDCGNGVYRMDCCGHKTEFDPEPYSLWDWIGDALDIEYRAGADKQYRSARFLVAFGGPNIFVDTETKSVDLFWWNERASYPISDDVATELDYIADEFWGCM